MGNTGLLRREAEMTLLQPHLGEMRRQELRNASFWLGLPRVVILLLEYSLTITLLLNEYSFLQ